MKNVLFKLKVKKTIAIEVNFLLSEKFHFEFDQFEFIHVNFPQKTDGGGGRKRASLSFTCRGRRSSTPPGGNPTSASIPIATFALRSLSPFSALVTPLPELEAPSGNRGGFQLQRRPDEVPGSASTDSRCFVPVLLYGRDKVWKKS